jgi:hypothetical protein
MLDARGARNHTRLSHKSGLAARRCLIPQRRRDVVAGGGVNLAQRCRLRVACVIHVGVLYNVADLCDSLIRKHEPAAAVAYAQTMAGLDHRATVRDDKCRNPSASNQEVTARWQII